MAQTIEQRISSAKGREESTLNLIFPLNQIHALIKEFGLSDQHDDVPTIVFHICKRIGLKIAVGKSRRNISERVNGQTSVALSFPIESVHELCDRLNVDQNTEYVRDLAKKIFNKLLPPIAV